MCDNKKAPTGAGTPARAGNKCRTQPDSNTEIKGCQIRVSDFLHHGSENPTSRRELEKLLNWRDREVTRAIESERRHGIPIAANGRGYFLPANDFELDDYLRRLVHRENEIKKTRVAVALTRQQIMDIDRGCE